jgi:hypothetical protein
LVGVSKGSFLGLFAACFGGGDLLGGGILEDLEGVAGDASRVGGFVLVLEDFAEESDRLVSCFSVDDADFSEGAHGGHPEGGVYIEEEFHLFGAVAKDGDFAAGVFAFLGGLVVAAEEGTVGFAEAADSFVDVAEAVADGFEKDGDGELGFASDFDEVVEGFDADDGVFIAAGIEDGFGDGIGMGSGVFGEGSEGFATGAPDRILGLGEKGGEAAAAEMWGEGFGDGGGELADGGVG